MPIPVITNFSINDFKPFDDRLVVTNSNAMSNMTFPYEGLTVYRTDTKLNYTFNGVTWSISSNGIYGGSGFLNSSTTTVDFGTVSSATNDVSRNLTFRSYTDSSSVFVRVRNNFIRTSSGVANTGISYRTQMYFGNDAGQSFEGPYIIFNPIELSSSGAGGISFGSLNEDDNTVYERFRIDGNGTIRFKPQSTVNDSTLSINIGIDESVYTGTMKPFIGYNWSKNGPDSTSLFSQQVTRSSYMLFDDDKISLNYFNISEEAVLGSPRPITTIVATHSVIFDRNNTYINGGLQVNGGAISTNKSISFGSADSLVHYVSFLGNGTGMKYDSQQNVAALSYRNSNGSGITDAIRWSNTPLVEVISPTYFSRNATLTVDSILRSTYYCSLWDNLFNPGASTINSDNSWTRSTISEDSNKNTATNDVPASNNVYIKLLGARTTVEFSIRANAYVAGTSVSAFSKSAFVCAPRDYDRLFYFYLDGSSFQVPHRLEWFLSRQAAANYVKIGNIENSNRGGYMQGLQTYGTTGISYMSRFYSQTVLVPAGMYFKIRFTFHVSYTPASTMNDNNSPILYMNVFRSGRVRFTGDSDTETVATAPPVTSPPSDA